MHKIYHLNGQGQFKVCYFSIPHMKHYCLLSTIVSVESQLLLFSLILLNAMYNFHWIMIFMVVLTFFNLTIMHLVVFFSLHPLFFLICLLLGIEKILDFVDCLSTVWKNYETLRCFLSNILVLFYFLDTIILLKLIIGLTYSWVSFIYFQIFLHYTSAWIFSIDL